MHLVLEQAVGDVLRYCVARQFLDAHATNTPSSAVSAHKEWHLMCQHVEIADPINLPPSLGHRLAPVSCWRYWLLFTSCSVILA